MKANRQPNPAHEDALRERFACPVCSGRNLSEDTVLLGGVVRFTCDDCGFVEVLDPRRRTT
jgi:transcription elongation factor Elf1